MLDIVIAIAALIITFPILLIIVILMLFSQGFPIIFSQKRIGRNFEPFMIYKLRTMESLTEDSFGLTRGASDERITAIGHFLRKHKLDELPQFINVLKGEMSVVGSRPQVPFYVEKFQDWYKVILTQRPGLVSTAAIKFSNEDELLDIQSDPVRYFEEVLIPEKCKMDIEMVVNFSVKTYFGLLFDYFGAFFLRSKE